ncbi:hypothetical protein Pmar_PMAR003123 [Perkinsus marinus ATCC 50983]|uniref:Uncharacterized protein n=1 Tax=Perkinsus marinus (strain ATCC 50983 / TXsc) TaxID=423536 RepID=C5L2Y8_PERM5|nr:hypothetical protein Pmar_PMAR003123 [Perkinsus marinus ATCC 50983]EER08875.1 hypothetical protein Pmar_PMAR003123 [Perkinsus marinus ATCC 50983]|eukprot:XP_002777059.1 hypothetical protein Pmar_PMAR003123 [Perkinsus marinus ATCC 50983]
MDVHAIHEVHLPINNCRRREVLPSRVDDRLVLRAGVESVVILPSQACREGSVASTEFPCWLKRDGNPFKDATAAYTDRLLTGRTQQSGVHQHEEELVYNDS